MEFINDPINTIIHKDNSLQKLNLAFQNHILKKEYKTANLLAYWINDFAKYHGEENTFHNRKFKVFKRGDLVKANLGFNVGNELGGLHYCIVLEKFDNPKNGTVTVVPLTSKKLNKIYHQSSLNLGKEIYEILKNKIPQNQNNIELKKLMQDSIVLIHQITTISKQRIFDEVILRKARISKESLQLLDKQIIKTFTHSLAC